MGSGPHTPTQFFWEYSRDSIPSGLRSQVVYKFTCAGCHTCYVSETTRHFGTTVREHLLSDRNSHICKHLQGSESCKNLRSFNCFSILDSALTNFQLKIKEALHIEWIRPALNKQLKHVNLALLLELLFVFSIFHRFVLAAFLYPWSIMQRFHWFVLLFYIL